MNTEEDNNLFLRGEMASWLTVNQPFLVRIQAGELHAAA